MRIARVLALASLIGLAFPYTSSAAANKEHLQLLAEIRMLQEQQQQLQAMLGTLSDAVKAVSTKLDEQSATTRKAMADQTLTLNGLGDNVRIVREKVDDSNVRIANVSQEIDALRQAIVASQAAAAAAAQPQPSVTGAPTEAPPAAAPGGLTPPVPTGNPLGVSPQRSYDTSFDDYTAGRLGLAIDGFNGFIRQFPTSPHAAEAQFYIGQSYAQQSKWAEARDAFQQVITNYPQSPQVPDAYYKLGQMYEQLNQIDLAKRAYETVVKNYPNSRTRILADQSLQRLNRK